MQQACNNAQQSLSQMAQMQQQLQQMQQGQSQAQSAMQQLYGGQGMQPGGGSGQGGQQAGTGEGGNPLGVEQQAHQYQTRYEGDIKQGQGKVIASWLENGEMMAGDATIEFDQAVTEARSSAEKAVTEDRVPRRFHNSLKSYFDNLPDSPGEVQDAPAAPR